MVRTRLVYWGAASVRLIKQHQEFERADQRQGGPGADQGPDRTVAQAVRQVGANRGHDASAEAPRRQRVVPAGPDGSRLVPPWTRPRSGRPP